MCESGKGIVKTDFDGKVVWRTMPFVVDGWGNYSCLAAADGKVYLVYERRDENAPVVKLVKVDAATGNYDIWPSGAGTMDIAIDPAPPALPPGSAVRPAYAFNIAGIAVKGQELFISDFNGDRILVHDAETGEKTREIPVKGPRGLWLHDGALVVATLPGAVVRVDPETGATATLVAEGPRRPLRRRGRRGGAHPRERPRREPADQDVRGRQARPHARQARRPRLPRQDRHRRPFQYPFGLAVDKTGVLMVTGGVHAENRDAPRCGHGRNAPQITTATRPIRPPTSPTRTTRCSSTYSLSGPDSFARARVPDAGGAGFPDASWISSAPGSRNSAPS
jgi:hypothetical protein